MPLDICDFELQLLFIDCMLMRQRLRLAACLGRWLFQNRLLLIMCRQTNTRIVRGPDTDEQSSLSEFQFVVGRGVGGKRKNLYLVVSISR